MLQSLLRRAARTRYDRVLAGAIIAPRDAPAVSSGSRGALRVLLLGSGAASGHGVSTYGLALVGALQRTLQIRLDRPVDVELVRQHGAGIECAAAIARHPASGDWDAYLLVFGLSDALRMTPVDAWSHGLGLVLSTIDDVRPSPLQVPVLVAGIPPLGSFPAHAGPLLPLLARHAARLDEATRRLLRHHPTASFVPLPAVLMAGERPLGSASAYEQWAEALADRLAPSLRGTVERLHADDGDARAALLPSALLHGEHMGARDRIRALTEVARRRLGGDYAAVNLVEGDQLLSVADSARSAGHRVPVAETICATTVVDDWVEVGDASIDQRFSGLALRERYGVRSYSGVALRDGLDRAIGTLSVLNGDAGRPGTADLLRAVASEVERELTGVAERSGSSPDSTAAIPPAPEMEDAARADDASPTLGRRERLLVHLGAARRLRSEGARLVEVPQHRSAPAARELVIAGPDPLRLLMIGGEYAVGYGARGRREALDGALARLIHRRTGRGVTVVNRSDDTIGLAGTAAALGRGGAESFDLVVWTPRFTEATTTLLRTRWVVGLGALAQQVRNTSDASLVLMGIPALIGHQPLAVLGRARARQINGVLALVARRHPRTHLALPSPVVLSEVATVDGAATYRAAAVHMFEVVMQAVDAVPRRGVQRAAGPEDGRPIDHVLETPARTRMRTRVGVHPLAAGTTRGRPRERIPRA